MAGSSALRLSPRSMSNKPLAGIPCVVRWRDEQTRGSASTVGWVRGAIDYGAPTPPSRKRLGSQRQPSTRVNESPQGVGAGSCGALCPQWCPVPTVAFRLSRRGRQVLNSTGIKLPVVAKPVSAAWEATQALPLHSSPTPPTPPAASPWRLRTGRRSAGPIPSSG
jgi:hypothetical protein